MPALKRWECRKCEGPNSSARLVCVDCGKLRDAADRTLEDIPLPGPRTTDVWHMMPSPGVAACGADYPNMKKTANATNVTCLACLRSAEAPPHCAGCEWVDGVRHHRYDATCAAQRPASASPEDELPSPDLSFAAQAAKVGAMYGISGRPGWSLAMASLMDRASRHSASASTRYRVGRKVGNTLYDGDEFIGSCVSPFVAEQLITNANRGLASAFTPPVGWCQGNGDCETAGTTCCNCRRQVRRQDSGSAPTWWQPDRRGGENRMNRSAYEELVTENLAWLKRQQPSLERDHIAVIVKTSVDGLYPPSASSDDAMLVKLRWLRDTVGVDIERMFARAVKEKDGRDAK